MVIPLTYFVDADAPTSVYIYGAHHSRLMACVARRQQVCVTVTLVDGLVYSRTALYHSTNYRSAVCFGRGRVVTDTAEQRRISEGLVRRYFPRRPAPPASSSSTRRVRRSVLPMQATLRNPTMPVHQYRVTMRWTGNLGQGTSGYRAYSRAHEITSAGKGMVACSSDPAFRGDASRYNPEELLVGSLSGCHMLWYLHLCADAGVVVEEYVDQPEGTMMEGSGGGGRFTEIVLRPRVRLAVPDDEARAHALHQRAHEFCFIANSMNFPVRVEPSFG